MSESLNSSVSAVSRDYSYFQSSSIVGEGGVDNPLRIWYGDLAFSVVAEPNSLWESNPAPTTTLDFKLFAPCPFAKFAYWFLVHVLRNSST